MPESERKNPSWLLVPGLIAANVALAGAAGYYTHLKQTEQIHQTQVEISSADILNFGLFIGVVIVGVMAVGALRKMRF